MPGHHYLPACYLRGFAPDGEKVVAIRVGSGASFQTSVRNVACEQGLYAVETVPGAKHGEETIERALAFIDGEFASARDRLVQAGAVQSVHDMSAILAMVASLRLRTPPALQDMDEMLDGFTKAHLVGVLCNPRARQRAIDAQVAAGFPREDVERALENMARLDQYRIDPSQTQRIALMMDLATDVNEAMLGMQWSVERASGRRRFITSDFPVSVSTPRVLAGRGVGCQERDAELVCPLTRDLALVGRWGYRRDQPVSDARVDRINRRTAWHSLKFLFADSADPRHVEYALAFTGAQRIYSEGLPARVDEEVARRGSIQVKQYLSPVPWDPPRRDRAA